MKSKRTAKSNGVDRVALFLGCRAKYLEPEVGKAMIQVLLKNGICPSFLAQKCCAMPKLACGDKEGFVRHGRFNVQSLFQSGCDIVTDCTSCSLTLKREYPEILRNGKSEAVAQRTFDVLEYLVMLRSHDRLKTDFRAIDLKVYYHSPCHLRALGTEKVDERIRLMKLIPGINLTGLENGGCCGMGGTFGFKKSNYEMSMAIGHPLFEKIKEISPAVVTTECSMCKTQIEQGTGLRVIHPVEIFRQAYDI